MPTRPPLLIAAALVASLAVPAAAQDRYDPGEPPPLPELPVDEWSDWDAAPDNDYLEDTGDQPSERAELPPAEAPVGYPLEQRAAWLGECRARIAPAHPEAHDQCEAFLLAHERAFTGPAAHPSGARFNRGGRTMGPVTWIKVPIVRKRRHGCD